MFGTDRQGNHGSSFLQPPRHRRQRFSLQNQPQLVIECKIAEVLDDGNPPPWYLYQGSRPREGVQPANRSSTNSNPPVGTGIMTREQYRSVVKLLEAMSGTDILTAPT